MVMSKQDFKIKNIVIGLVDQPMFREIPKKFKEYIGMSQSSMSSNLYSTPRDVLAEEMSVNSGFSREYFDDGIDPIAPIIRQEKDNIIIAGIGLFRDDRYITKIEPEKGIIFSILKKKFKQGQIKIDIKDDENSENYCLLRLGVERDAKKSFLSCIAAIYEDIKNNSFDNENRPIKSKEIKKKEIERIYKK